MRKTLSTTIMALSLVLRANGAPAAEIKVLSTGNMQTILGQVAPDFERASGHNLKIEYGSTPRIKARAETESADLTINERYVLDDLLRQGRVVAGTFVDVARSPFAIGVRVGAPKPDVSSLDALKRTLLAAESIAQPDAAGGAQDGTFFVSLIGELGIADQVKPKIKLAQGGDNAAKLVASGGAQMGVAQRRNFLALAAVEMLEPLPDRPGFKFLMVAGLLAGDERGRAIDAKYKLISRGVVEARAVPPRAAPWAAPRRPPQAEREPRPEQNWGFGGGWGSNWGRSNQGQRGWFGAGFN